MSVEDRFADCQTQAAVALGSGAGFVGAIKTLAKVRQIFGSDSWPGVADGEEDGGIIDSGVQVNFALGLIVMNRVHEEIDHHLPQAVGISQSDRRLMIGADHDSRAVSERLDAFDAQTPEFSEVHPFFLEILLPGVEAGEIEQRFRELPHLLGGIEAGLHCFAILAGISFAGEGGLCL